MYVKLDSGHIFNFMFSRRFSLQIHLKYFKTQIILFTLILSHYIYW